MAPKALISSHHADTLAPGAHIAGLNPHPKLARIGWAGALEREQGPTIMTKVGAVPQQCSERQAAPILQPSVGSQCPDFRIVEPQPAGNQTLLLFERTQLEGSLNSQVSCGREC